MLSNGHVGVERRSAHLSVLRHGSQNEGGIGAENLSMHASRATRSGAQSPAGKPRRLASIAHPRQSARRHWSTSQGGRQARTDSTAVRWAEHQVAGLCHEAGAVPRPLRDQSSSGTLITSASERDACPGSEPPLGAPSSSGHPEPSATQTNDTASRSISASLKLWCTAVAFRWSSAVYRCCLGRSHDLSWLSEANAVREGPDPGGGTPLAR